MMRTIVRMACLVRSETPGPLLTLPSRHTTRLYHSYCSAIFRRFGLQKLAVIVWTPWLAESKATMQEARARCFPRFCQVHVCLEG